MNQHRAASDPAQPGADRQRALKDRRRIGADFPSQFRSENAVITFEKLVQPDRNRIVIIVITGEIRDLIPTVGSRPDADPDAENDCAPPVGEKRARIRTFRDRDAVRRPLLPA